MRLDKYLKVSRILKRRTISKELAEHERIMVNNKIAKPSYDVKAGDLITIIFGTRLLTVKVIQTLDFTKKEDSSLMYEVVEEKRVDNTGEKSI